jgi:hypothetical protein
LNLPFNGNFSISIELITSLSDEFKYVGYQLYLNGGDDPFFTHAFPKPLEVPLSATVDCSVHQAIGIISSDKKNSWAIQEQGESANTINNYIACIAPRDSLKDNPPSWMADKYPDNPLF